MSPATTPPSGEPASPTAPAGASWRKGCSNEAVWLQYGAFSPEADRVLLIVQRWRGTRRAEMQLCLSHWDGGTGEGAEVPRLAHFQFDAGEASTSFVGGVGFVVENAGLVWFTTGQGTHDKDLSVFKPVLDAIVHSFGIVVDDRPFDFAIDAASRATLVALLDGADLPAEP